MLIVGLVITLIGTIMIALASVRDFALNGVVTCWGFIIVILGVVCLVSGLN